MRVLRLIQAASTAIAATEAAAFEVRPKDGDVDFDLLIHLRPDNPGPKTRKAAIDAFKDMIRQCLTSGKNGVFEIGDESSAGRRIDPQYCLVVWRGSGAKIVSVSAFIVRCPNPDAAAAKLQTVEVQLGWYTGW